MIRPLTFSTGSVFQHDDSVSELTIRANVPNFFRTKMGQRESYSFYRGFVIVRTTRKFTNCKPERVAVLYVYLNDLEGSPDTLHVNVKSNNVKTIKRQIDKILESGVLEPKE